MLEFCLFSYNRGQFLENCIASLEHCAPNCKVTIFDDDSTDPHAQRVLKEAAKKHKVVTPKKMDVAASKFGGLYNNMQAAITMLPDDALVCFIQDDMQMVRCLDQQDIDDIHQYFEVNENAAFLHPAFLRGSNRKRDSVSAQWQEESQSYYREGSKQSAGVHFSAIIITRIDRLRKVNWAFENREKINDQRAAKLFGKMGFMKNPFCLWLPNVPVYRGKTKTLALKIAERIRQIDYFPCEIMSADENKTFRLRDRKALPFSEDFIRLKDGVTLKEPWIYHALEGITFLKHLNRIELKLRNLFK